MADEVKKVSPARAKKEIIIAEIADRLEASSGLVFTNYQGLTHKQIEGLKRALKEVGASFSVTKNTLLKLSLGKTDKFKDKIKDEIFNDPTATVFISGDSIEALKKLMKSNKDFGFPKIKSGILDGAELDESQLIKLSTLPNRTTLLAQFIGTLNSPIQGLVVVLNGNLQKLVIVLSAVARLPRPEPPARIDSQSVSGESDGGQAKSKPVHSEPVGESAPAEQTAPTQQTPVEDQAQVSEPSSAPQGATEGQEGGDSK